MKVKTYRNLDGIKQAAADFKGTERIHMGIRPYEMHAGNMLALVAYPMLMCQETAKRGITPQYEFIVSINDWEQAELGGHDIYTYHFDIWPVDSTIQFLIDDESGLPSAAHWGQVITERVATVSDWFPSVKVTPKFNSHLREQDAMKHVILQTIARRKELKQLLLDTTGIPTTGDDTHFANALCPKCNHANTNSEVDGENITVNCKKCGFSGTDSYENYWYWLHHKPLFAARWEIFGFDASLSGGDHFKDKDVESRKALYEFFFGKPCPNISMIFTPIMIGKDGNKMSKSRRNYFSADIESIMAQASKNPGDSIRLHYA